MSYQFPSRNSGSKPGRDHAANVVHAHGPDLDTRPGWRNGYNARCTWCEAQKKAQNWQESQKEETQNNPKRHMIQKTWPPQKQNQNNSSMRCGSPAEKLALNHTATPSSRLSGEGMNNQPFLQRVNGLWWPVRAMSLLERSTTVFCRFILVKSSLLLSFMTRVSTTKAWSKASQDILYPHYKEMDPDISNLFICEHICMYICACTYVCICIYILYNSLCVCACVLWTVSTCGIMLLGTSAPDLLGYTWLPEWFCPLGPLGQRLKGWNEGQPNLGGTW